MRFEFKSLLFQEFCWYPWAMHFRFERGLSFPIYKRRSAVRRCPHCKDKCLQLLRCYRNHMSPWIRWSHCCPEAAIYQLETHCIERFCVKANSATTVNDAPMGLEVRDAMLQGALAAGFKTLVKEQVLLVILMDEEQFWRPRWGGYLLLVMYLLKSRLQPWDSTDLHPR